MNDHECDAISRAINDFHEGILLSNYDLRKMFLIILCCYPFFYLFLNFIEFMNHVYKVFDFKESKANF